MKAVIFSIGNEVVSGSIVNTNAAYLAKRLSEEGFEVERHLAINDGDPCFEQLLANAFEVADLVITTGGLGPTCDDLTRKTLCQFFDCEMRFDERVAMDLKTRYGKLLVSIEDQASIPSLAQALLNPVGTAPGLVFQKEDKWLVALPGVPSEMKGLLEEGVFPYFKKYLPANHFKCVEILHLCLVFESLIDPLLRSIDEQFSELELGIYPQFGSVTLVFKGNKQQVQQAKELILAQFARFQFEAPSGQIAEAVHLKLLQSGIKLCLAESCTGGNIAKLLTTYSGASDYLLGSFVVYSNELKKNILGVPESILDTVGAVSQETVLALVKGVFEKTTSDMAIAVSGIAGPCGGSEEKPVGTVWVAIAKRGEIPHAFCLKAIGNREAIIQKASHRILAQLYYFLNFNRIEESTH